MPNLILNVFGNDGAFPHLETCLFPCLLEKLVMTRTPLVAIVEGFPIKDVFATETAGSGA
jgi:hypothetical protein